MIIMNTQIIIFTRDRPLQCDLLLKSMSLHLAKNEYDKDDTLVLYSSSSEQYYDGYRACIRENKDFKFFNEIGFYKNLKDAISLLEKDYILFLTDDSIFVNKFSIKEIEDRMSHNHRLLSFSLRLGLNTKYCYSLSVSQGIPPYNIVDDKFMVWDWKHALYDWSYPMEVSSSIMRTKHIKEIVDKHSFVNPNWLEWFMAQYAINFYKNFPQSMSYLKSVAFSSPINKVDPHNKNRASNNKEYSTENLLQKYLDGLRIDPENFSSTIPSAAHQEAYFNLSNKEKAI